LTDSFELRLGNELSQTGAILKIHRRRLTRVEYCHLRAIEWEMLEEQFGRTIQDDLKAMAAHLRRAPRPFVVPASAGQRDSGDTTTSNLPGR